MSPATEPETASWPTRESADAVELAWRGIELAAGDGRRGWSRRGRRRRRRSPARRCYRDRPLRRPREQGSSLRRGRSRWSTTSPSATPSWPAIPLLAGNRRLVLPGRARPRERRPAAHPRRSASDGPPSSASCPDVTSRIAAGLLASAPGSALRRALPDRRQGVGKGGPMITDIGPEEAFQPHLSDRSRGRPSGEGRIGGTIVE